MDVKENLYRKIQEKQITIGVIGLGYVGLPLSVEAAKEGYKTIGFDVCQKKVDLINSGQSDVADVQSEAIVELLEKKIFYATSDFTKLSETDFIFICVPTPLDEDKNPDLSFVYNSALLVGEYIKKETVVVLESTTYPGTTEEFVLPIIEEKSNLKCGVDFYLGFAPERVDPGNKIYQSKNTPRLVSGIGQDATEIICKMYKKILDSEVIKVSSPKVAEMAKLLENTYRNINIALVNEIAIICEKIGVSVWEVIDAAKTKPYGFQAFYPGPGPGGHCIPLDPMYLAWKLKEFDYEIKMIAASSEINNHMSEYIVERCEKILFRLHKAVVSSQILILGVAYKPDVADYRESPAIRVIEGLKRKGASVEFYDPFINEYTYQNKLYQGIPQLTESVLRKFDLVVITTAHTSIDYELIQKESAYIFDTRNVLKHITNRQNIQLL